MRKNDSDVEALLHKEDGALMQSSWSRTRTAAAGAAVLGAAVLAATSALAAGGTPLPRAPWSGAEAVAKSPEEPTKVLPRWSPSVAAVDRKMLTDSKQRVCTTVSGKDLLGDMMDKENLFTGEDVESCRERCRVREECGCYSFDPSRDNTCWLKKSPCNELYTWEETADMTTGTCRVQRPQVCSTVFGKDVMADQLTVHGKPVEFSGPREDAVTCRARCEETVGCNCYAFDPSRNNTCWLKQGACDEFYDWDESSDMLSGNCHEQRPVFDWPMSTQSDDGSKLAATAKKMDPGASRQICSTVPGQDIAGAAPLDDGMNGEYPGSSASSCRSRCASTQACKCYAFDPSRNHTCWLKGSGCHGDFITWPETMDMVSGKCQQGRPLLDWPLRATAAEAGPLERFRAVAGARNGTIALLSHHGTYVTAQSDGSVTVDGDSMGAWETFEEVRLPDGRVALKSYHGGFLTASDDGMVSVDAKGAGKQESFKVVEHAEEDSLSLQTGGGKFLTAVRLGAGAGVLLRGDRETVGSWATFIIRAKPQDSEGGRTLLLDSSWLDNTVTLQSYLGTYVSVVEDGKVRVDAEEEKLTECAEFKLVKGPKDWKAPEGAHGKHFRLLPGAMALRTCQGTYLSAREDGSIHAGPEVAGPWEQFLIETVDSKAFFSALDLPVSRTGNLTEDHHHESKLDMGSLPNKAPQPVVLKTVHGGYLFPLEESERVSDVLQPSKGTRVTQAMIFSRTCEDGSLMPINDRSTCEAAAKGIGLVKAKESADVRIVKDAGVPEGCYAENRTHFRLGTNSGNKGTGVVVRDDGTALNPICAGTCPVCTPSNPTAPAVVILFYERDLCKMRLLAASLTKHDPGQLIGTVHLVWLSKRSPGEFMGDIDSIRNSAAASHTVRFHDLSWMFGSGMQGWHVQQIVKLKASGLVEEDYYVVFDAKNAFIRDVQPDTFLTPCYQGRVFADTDFENLGEAKGWYYSSAAALGVEVPPGRKWSASITPVVMHTKTVIDMLNYLHESPSPLSLCSGALCGHIKGGATEFTLYYLYVATRTDEKCIHQASAHNPAISMWRGTLSLNEGIVQTAATDPNVKLFGGQSGAFRGMGDDVRQRLSAQMQEIFEDAGVHDDSSFSADALAACVVGG